MNEYMSTFSNYIHELTCQKQSIGYKYLSEAAVLKRFDTFCHKNYHQKSGLSLSNILSMDDSYLCSLFQEQEK